ncbi:MAG: hypothetical protein QF796_06975 [Acidimicrobiales bacterium]|nr:hypothetical protein [Acidimicrobiales bacterium]MDP6649861.1 hypothetical protein [Acidimicrobiales bacterium]MDP6760749.1 hypothetical protein [Acidimicrobiales bacterium]
MEEPDGVGITYFVDGILDCPMEGRYSTFATLSSEAVGEPTPKEASVKAPASFREVHGGGVSTDPGHSEMPVAGGREVVSVLASGLSAGRSWAVMPTAWCPGFGPNER